MTLCFDLYWSFRSPYSYLITPRLVALEREYDVRGRVRPVYPLAVRTPEFFETRDPAVVQLFPGRHPPRGGFPRPAVPLAEARSGEVRPGDGSYPQEQPYIHRLTHLGVAAAERAGAWYSSPRPAG